MSKKDIPLRERQAVPERAAKNRPLRQQEIGGNMIRTQIYFTPEQHDWLRDRAHYERRSMADIVRELVEQDRTRFNVY